jgi:hypothetical protein
MQFMANSGSRYADHQVCSSQWKRTDGNTAAVSMRPAAADASELS